MAKVTKDTLIGELLQMDMNIAQRKNLNYVIRVIILEFGQVKKFLYIQKTMVLKYEQKEEIILKLFWGLVEIKFNYLRRRIDGKI